MKLATAFNSFFAQAVGNIGHDGVFALAGLVSFHLLDNVSFVLAAQTRIGLDFSTAARDTRAARTVARHTCRQFFSAQAAAIDFRASSGFL